MRRVLIAAGLLVGLLLLTDRVTAVIAANAVAAQLQSSGELQEQPSVSIRGFPFLSQAFGGRYERVEVEARDLDGRDLRLASMDVTVRGAQVPLRDALSGNVKAVPVESLLASALVDFDELAEQSDLPEASVRPAGDQLEITTRLLVLDRQVTVTCRCAVSLDGGRVRLTPQSVQVEGGSNELLDDAVRDQFALRMSVGRLPYGLRLTGVRVTKDGLLLSARSGPTVLQRP